MLFSFSVSLLGLIVGFRIVRFFIDRKLLAPGELTKIGTAYLITVTILISFLPHARFSFWGAVFAPLVLTFFMLIYLVQKRSRQFRERFRETLTLIILKMKSGKAFRLSLSETVNESDSSYRIKLGEIASVVAFSQQNVEVGDDEFVREVIIELLKVDQTPHSAIQRLCVFRDRLELESDFRHRSGQALAQIRAQSLVMTGLYIAIFVFVVSQFGWQQNAQLFLFSALLFACGAFWIWLGGRKIKWKV